MNFLFACHKILCFCFIVCQRLFNTSSNTEFKTFYYYLVLLRLFITSSWNSSKNDQQSQVGNFAKYTNDSKIKMLILRWITALLLPHYLLTDYDSIVASLKNNFYDNDVIVVTKSASAAEFRWEFWLLYRCTVMSQGKVNEQTCISKSGVAGPASRPKKSFLKWTNNCQPIVYWLLLSWLKNFLILESPLC